MELLHSLYFIFVGPSLSVQGKADCEKHVSFEKSWLWASPHSPTHRAAAQAWRLWCKHMAFSLWFRVRLLSWEAETTHCKFPQLQQQQHRDCLALTLHGASRGLTSAGRRASLCSGQILGPLHLQVIPRDKAHISKQEDLSQLLKNHTELGP